MLLTYSGYSLFEDCIARKQAATLLIGLCSFVTFVNFIDYFYCVSKFALFCNSFYQPKVLFMCGIYIGMHTSLKAISGEHGLNDYSLFSVFHLL